MLDEEKLPFLTWHPSGLTPWHMVSKQVSKNICTRRKKSNSHYAPQPYTNQSVFKSLLNCASEMFLSRNATGREFQRNGPATEKLLSPRRVPVLIVAHVKTSADRKSWQSSAMYCGSWPCNASCTRTASLKSMRCGTGNHAAPGELVWYAPVFQFSWSVGQRHSGPTGVSAAGYRQFHTAGCCSSLACWIWKPGPPS